MSKKVLILNVGSTSIKIQFFSHKENNINKLLYKISASKIGTDENNYIFENVESKKRYKISIPNLKFLDTFKNIVTYIKKEHNILFNEIAAIGHRIVHGYKYFTKATIIEEEELNNLKKTFDYAPLHNPFSVKILEYIHEKFPSIINIGVFDTSFCSSMKPKDFIYPIPYRYYENYNIRRYGAHGINLEFVTNYFTELLNDDYVSLIVCHIGGGASVSSVSKSRCIYNSMGLTPLGGVPMVTRSGSIDPSVILEIANKDNKTLLEVINILNTESGIKGISELDEVDDFDNVVEEVRKSKNKKVILALDLFCQDIVNEIGKCYFRMSGKVNAIVFTGGIGANSLQFRYYVTKRLQKILKINIADEELKQKVKEFLILNTDKKSPMICILQANEEKVILKKISRLIKK